MTYSNGMYYPIMGYQQQVQPPTPHQSGIIWVQGEAGAKSYLVAPNTTVQLWDSEAPVIYLKSCDASGMPSIKTLDYTTRENASPKPTPSVNFLTMDNLVPIEERLSALEGKLEALNKPTTRKKETKDE